MHDRMRRLAAVCSVLVWLGGSVLTGGNMAWAGGVQGAPGAPGIASGVEKGPRITLEQAIGVTRQFVQIPEDYKNFQPNYSEGEQQGAFWDLRWDSGASGSGSVDARVNALTGELWGLDWWQPEPQGTNRQGLPRLSRTDALTKAETFLRTVLPQYYGQLGIDTDATSGPDLGLRAGFSPVCTYSFVRLVAGIPFPENNANIQIDARSGAVKSFHFNWDSQLVFPDVQRALPPSQAASLWRENAQVGLEYFSPPTDGKFGVAPARLVYTPKNRTMMIDAKTGAILKPEAYSDYRSLGMGGAGNAMMDKALQAAPLTPAEQAALTELGKLISQDKALAIASALVEITPGYVLQNSSLQQEYFSNRKIWSFFWRERDGQNSIEVRVDAGQGQLIGFSLAAPAAEQSSAPRLDEAQAQDLANRLLDRVAGDYLGQLEILKASPTPPIKLLSSKQPAPQPTSFFFNANRLVKGIHFGGNGVQITVDAVQGKVTSYQLNWWEMKFPEAKGVVGQARAEDVFLSDGALELNYRRDFAAPGQMPEDRPVRLVYVLKDQAPVYVDAFDGLGLAGDFQPRLNPSRQAFDDLSGQAAAGAVKLLTESRIIPVFEPAFHPQARLSQRDWLIWLVRADGWQPVPAGDPDQEYDRVYHQALMMGILKPGESYQPQQDLDRATMARMVVRALGWDEVASFQGIWSLPPGTDHIQSGDQGYLSLAAGLGIVDLSDRDFDPASGLTRVEGALALYKILN